MKVATQPDPETGVPVATLTSGDARHLLPYYTSLCLSSNGRYVCCTRTEGDDVQACLIDLESASSRLVSNVPGGILEESVTFHPDKPWLFYGAPEGVYRYDIATETTDVLYRCAPGFRVKSELSSGKNVLVFWIFENLDLAAPLNPGEAAPVIKGIHTLRNCRSYILGIELDSGKIFAVWGDTAPLTHPVISPTDDCTVLYANQGIHERRQELFTIHLHERDNRAPLCLYETTAQRPIYVGHSFFTYDGWVGTQLIEFGGLRDNGSFGDMTDYNAIIRADGTCDRRARVPGGNKPLHTHCAYADSWWVGDTLPLEGAPCRDEMLCIMKNNWETGFAQAEPFVTHGCSHSRRCHVHPRFSPDETMVLYNTDAEGGSQVKIAFTAEFFANWQDCVSFEPRQYRHGKPPRKKKSQS